MSYLQPSFPEPIMPSVLQVQGTFRYDPKERERMYDYFFGGDKVGTKYEGYWASNIDPSKDVYCGLFPFPIASASKWKGQELFEDRLRYIQEHKAHLDHYYGCSYSRLTKDCRLGCSEYSLRFSNGVRWVWPGDYLSHYICQHNVIPTEEFCMMIVNLR